MCVLFFSLSLAISERSSHRRFSLKSVLKSFAKLTGKYLCQSRPETLLRKRIRHMYFPVIFIKFSLNTFFIEHFWAPALSLFLESIIVWGFLSSNLPDMYLWFSWFFLEIFLFYLSSNNDHTNSFDSQSLYFMFVDWIRCRLVFFFKSMNWSCKKEKIFENSSECFTHDPEKTVRVFNQVLSKLYWATKLKSSSTVLR